MYKIVIIKNSFYKKNICILMIRTSFYVIISFSHAIRLVKSDHQFVYNILKVELHYQINLIRLINVITRLLYQICLTDKSDGNNYLYV